MLSQSKPSRQSSTFSANHPSEKAFDGDLNQVFPGGSCSLTNCQKSAWVQVDLLKTALIQSVKIYNRIDAKSERLNNALILASDVTGFSTSQLCSKFEYIATVNQIQTFYCLPKVTGRYVQLPVKNKPLNVCEMQVFGHFTSELQNDLAKDLVRKFGNVY